MLKTDHVAAPEVDFEAIKTKQRGAWGSGDYAIVGVTLQIVGEMLAEAADIGPGEKVLDVAAGNGNATLAAARRFCDVTSSDYVPELLEKGRVRAEAEGMDVTFKMADAENLPFRNNEYDAVMSTFGVMFTPNQEKAAAEMMRVCRPGGRVALANWTPDGFIGQLFQTIGRHVPPPAGVRSPALWGVEARLETMFGEGASDISATRRNFAFRYRSTHHWLDLFRSFYGPVLKAFEATPAELRDALAADLIETAERFNRAEDGSMITEAEYLEVVITKKF